MDRRNRLRPIPPTDTSLYALKRRAATQRQSDIPPNAVRSEWGRGCRQVAAPKRRHLMVSPRECGRCGCPKRGRVPVPGERGRCGCSNPVSAPRLRSPSCPSPCPADGAGRRAAPIYPRAKRAGSWGWLGKRAPGGEAGTRKGESASQRALPGPLGGVRVITLGATAPWETPKGRPTPRSGSAERAGVGCLRQRVAPVRREQTEHRRQPTVGRLKAVRRSVNGATEPEPERAWCGASEW